MESRSVVSAIKKLQSARKPTLVFLHRCRNAPSERIGFLSGSFNPPTIAHLRMGQVAQERLGLDQIVLILSIRNVDKGSFDFPLETRSLMMIAIARSQQNWGAALCSHGLFVDKAIAARSAFPRPAELFFIVGQDTFQRLFEDRFYPPGKKEDFLKNFFQEAQLIVFPRPSPNTAALSTLLDGVGTAPFGDRIFILELEPAFMGISSTLVRHRLKEGLPVNEFVPDPVIPFLTPAKAWRTVLPK
ncbi:MAG: nicotinate-nicotinamide nucleotide adenylyltransferase [Armatimonadetes bacterium]|nr:nicotinate-nicotinamide nucleotide adenylyltransferase [Armatimonadota bacterium]